MTAPPARWSMLVLPVRQHQRSEPLCHASGWGVALGFTRGDGTIVCPVCSQTVPTRHDPQLGSRVQVVDDHRSERR